MLQQSAVHLVEVCGKYQVKLRLGYLWNLFQELPSLIHKHRTVHEFVHLLVLETSRTQLLVAYAYDRYEHQQDLSCRFQIQAKRHGLE